MIALWSTIEQRAGTMMSVDHKSDMVVLSPAYGSPCRVLLQVDHRLLPLVWDPKALVSRVACQRAQHCINSLARIQLVAKDTVTSRQIGVCHRDTMYWSHS